MHYHSNSIFTTIFLWRVGLWHQIFGKFGLKPIMIFFFFVVMSVIIRLIVLNSDENMCDRKTITINFLIIHCCCLLLDQLKRNTQQLNYVYIPFAWSQNDRNYSNNPRLTLKNIAAIIRTGTIIWMLQYHVHP